MTQHQGGDRAEILRLCCYAGTGELSLPSSVIKYSDNSTGWPLFQVNRRGNNIYLLVDPLDTFPFLLKANQTLYDVSLTVVYVR